MTSLPTPTSSFSVKRFMAHKRNGSEESDIFPSEDIETSSIEKRKASLRGMSWLPQARKRDVTPVSERRMGSIRKISSPMPTLYPNHPYSSTSSLSSFERPEPPRSSTPTKNKAAATLGMSSAQLSRSASVPPKAPKRPTRPKAGLHDHDDDILEDEIEPESASSVPESSAQSVSERRPSRADKRRSSEWSDNVQQLIKETDQAFSELSHDRLGSLDFTMPEMSPPLPLAPLSKTDEEVAPEVKATEDEDKPQSSHQERASPPENPQQTELAPVPAPTPAPISKPLPIPSASMMAKARKASRSKAAPRRASKSQGMVSRWNLPEGVADILTGQRFKKIEVEEMLTPARIEQLTRAREDKLQQEQNMPRKDSQVLEDSRSLHEDATKEATKENAESTSVGSGSPSSGTSASISEESSPELATIQERNSMESVNGQEPGLISDKSDSSEEEDEVDTSAEDTGEEEDGNDEVPDFILDDRQTTVFPPPKNPARVPAPRGNHASKLNQRSSKVSVGGTPKPSSRSASRRQSTMSRRTSTLSKRQSVSQGLRSEENDEFLFLKSTPYSLTKPMFRHGPITLSKADMGKAVMTMDDTMDWTAFQMAILGGAGELFPDETIDEDFRLAQDLGDWLEEYGFSTLGGLVGEPALGTSVGSSSRSSSRSTISSARSTDNDLPIPISCEHPGANLLGGANSTYDNAKFFRRSGQLRAWTADGEAPNQFYGSSGSGVRGLRVNKKQAQQMPMVAGSDDEADDVAMGYNLNQDLGDFLRWEAEHMNGSGF